MLLCYAQLLTLTTCFGIVDGPNLLAKLEVSEEEPDPDTSGDTESLGFGVEDGAAHAGD